MSRPAIPASTTSAFSLDEPGPYENAQMTMRGCWCHPDDPRCLRGAEPGLAKDAQKPEAHRAPERVADLHDDVFVHSSSAAQQRITEAAQHTIVTASFASTGRAVPMANHASPHHPRMPGATGRSALSMGSHEG